MYKEKIIDVETGQETWRDYTEEEIAQVEQARKQGEELARKAEMREKARQSALSKLIDLGLTEDEIAAL